MALVHIVKTTAGIEKHVPENGNGKITVVLEDGTTTKELILTDG